MDEDLHATGRGAGGGGPDDREDGIDMSERIDLSALDPTADPGRFEPLVRSIAARAASELTRRGGQSADAINRPFDEHAITVVKVIRGWQRLLWPVAAAITLASLATLRLVEHPSTETESADSQLAQALGVPAYMASWVSGDEIPGPAELVFSQEEQ
jgi:hypothetical protein